MGSVIGDLLPLAVTVAISPIPIIAAILMLLSKQAGATSAGFAVGWVVGIVVATVIFVLLAGSIGDSDSPGTTAGVIKLVLGLVLAGLGVKQWLGRHDKTGPPKWMQAIDSFTAAKAAGLGFVLAAVNPKNLLMCVAAGVTIGAASISGGAQVVCVVVFTVIAACSVLVPVIGYRFAADRMTRPLDELRGWLQQNNAAVMSVLFFVIGVVLVGKGISGLS